MLPEGLFFTLTSSCMQFVENMNQLTDSSVFLLLEKPYLKRFTMKKRILIILAVFAVCTQGIVYAKMYQDKPSGTARVEECDVDALFYSVQLGVFSKPVSPDVFPKITTPVYYVKRADGLYSYFSGLYDDRFAAMRKRYQIIKDGNSDYDIYISAYYKRDQINMVRADELIEQYGESIVYNPETVKI